MRVTTPIADLDITIQSLRVQEGALVLENASNDAIPTRAVLDPVDIRRLLRAMLQPAVIGFALKSLVCASRSPPRPTSKAADDHPTAHPW